MIHPGTGGLTRLRRKSKPLLAYFQEKVSPEPNTGCWLWTGNEARGGYGVSGHKDA